MSASSSRTASLVDPPPFRRGTRVTPRTCLWPLAGSLVLTFSLSIGLTFVSNNNCYAATCGERLFPLQARLHVVVWYSWISISVTILAVRAFHPELRKFLARNLTQSKLPLVGKNLSISGALVCCWIVSLYGIVVGIWWIRLRQYFVDRGEESGVNHGGNRLAAVALTGHLADITMGMVLIPISRHSALASFFHLSVSTTLTNHMLCAYTLFLLVLAHGLLYVSWVPFFDSLSTPLRRVLPVLNPTYLFSETWPGDRTSLGVWRASLIFSGIFAACVMCAIFITTLPAIRKKHFNTFYFTHLLGIVMVVVICLHASTMFYCVAPGLAMWCLDWGMRLHELRRVMPGEITTIGKGWYCVTVPLPRGRLTGCSCRSPLAHFYIHHAQSSMRELHPFTTITHLATQHATTSETAGEFPIQFLFRKRSHKRDGTPRRPPVPAREHAIIRFTNYFRSTKPVLRQPTQWTDRLAELVDVECRSDAALPTVSSDPRAPVVPYGGSSPTPFPRIDVSLRLEGPYFSPAEPSRYNTVVCLVAGTGVSGAIAIAGAFAELQRSRIAIAAGEKQYCGPNCGPSTDTNVLWNRCVVVWSVRDVDHVELPYLKENAAPGLEVQTHLTGGDRPRLNAEDTLAAIRKDAPGDKIYVYISGPKPFIDAGAAACKAASGVDFYAASWEI